MSDPKDGMGKETGKVQNSEGRSLLAQANDSSYEKDDMLLHL